MERHKQLNLVMIYSSPKHRDVIGLPVNNQQHSKQHNSTAQQVQMTVWVHESNKDSSKQQEVKTLNYKSLQINVG